MSTFDFHRLTFEEAVALRLGESQMTEPPTALTAWTSDPWVVEVKGQAGAHAFEIAVRRQSNERGHQSYGWFGEDKLLVTHNGGPCDWPIIPFVWDGAVRLAHELADHLNATEP